MGNVLVEIENVTKRIGKRTIIDSLSLKLMPGEVFGFLGPNGSGKTTTIRMMVGLMAMTSGEIKIDGYSIKSNYEKAIKQVGAIVENPEMYKYLTGYQNLLHFARMIPGITKERINEVIQLVGMQARIHEKVKTYSLGMRQRLGVAQALLHNPKLLILDEPTNGLDPAGIRELRDYLRRLCHEEGITVFVSSHLLSEMELMCDKVAIIQNGKLIDIRTIKGVEAQASNKSMIIETNNAELAARILTEKGAALQVKENGILNVTGNREDRAAYNALLVQAGVMVYSIREEQKSLEDQFLEVTGGEQIG